MWRKLISRPKNHPNAGQLYCSAQVIGKNPISQFGVKIALWLGYEPEHAALFTGHWARRTSITWMANDGLTTLQLKACTGHNSTSSLEGYVASSTHMKATHARALHLRDNVRRPTDQGDEDRAPPAPPSSMTALASSPPMATYYINLAGSTIGGVVNPPSARPHLSRSPRLLTSRLLRTK